MPTNFNNSTFYKTFPALSITEEEAKAKSSPTFEDPGFIVEWPDGSWKWEKNLTDAYVAALDKAAIYQSWTVCDYFKQFARVMKDDMKTGKEVDEGPVK